MNLFSVRIDTFSLILGMLLATILWWAVQAARPAARQVRESLRKRREEGRERAASGTEERYRRMVLGQAQGMHLAASLFSLDEIIDPPLLLAPPVRIEPGNPPHTDDIVSLTVPYTPAWPELASHYKAPTLSLAEALSGGTNIIVIGQPGCGKTVALAHLAIQVINKHPAVESLHSCVPFLLHIADVDLPLENDSDALHSIIETVAEEVSVFDLSRTPGFVRSAFETGRALLLLDGLDELAPAAIREAADFLRHILKTFPKTRVVTTGSPEHIDGLIGLGFTPLAMASWDDSARERVLARWSELWERFVAHEAWAQAELQHVDSLLLETWLKSDNLGLSPLEFILKVWGAYAGDVLGSRPQDAVAMQIKRLTPASIPPTALQLIGMQANANGSAVFNSHSAREWIKAFEVSEDPNLDLDELQNAALSTDEEESKISTSFAQAGSEDSTTGMARQAEEQVPGTKTTTALSAPRASLLSRLSNSGLLTSHRGNRLRFSHPVFAGSLAGKGYASQGQRSLLSKQPPWSGRTLAMHYYAIEGDAAGLYDSLTSKDDVLLERGVLTAVRWLSESPREGKWREKLMARLAELLQSDGPLGLRAQILNALVLSHDPATASLLRQFMQASSADLRVLAALGCGALRDPKAVDTLIDLLQDHDPTVRRAASLALVSIGVRRGLVALATTLQHSNEESRRSAAEALANNAIEGHQTLREGASSSDILLRRAVVFGLARVNEPWAWEILEKMQIQDEQWVVRTLAIEFTEAHRQPNPHIPHKLTLPAETPWLIEFAGRLGMGVTPGQPATDLFLLALKSEKEDERYGALNYLRYSPSEGVLGALFGCIYGQDSGLREAAYYLVWEMSITGTKIPSPQQFGLG